MSINFQTTREDADTILAIVQRAKAIYKSHEIDLDAFALTMDITAVHVNGCPLKLQELLAADNMNFLHDVSGIHRHINRETGALMDCFLPRFAA